MSFHVQNEVAKDHYRELLQAAENERLIRWALDDQPHVTVLTRLARWIGEHLRQPRAIVQRRAPECETC
jgi:hypothetical protein